MQVHEDLRDSAASSLSKADVIAALGAHAVAVTGGPQMPLCVGRPDATVADPPGRLSKPSAPVATLLADFSRQGLTPRDFVALLGAHTIGRLPGGAGAHFDNVYFRVLLDTDLPRAARGMRSDRSLLEDAGTRAEVERFAADEAAFFEDFAAAYGRLVNHRTMVCR